MTKANNFVVIDNTTKTSPTTETTDAVATATVAIKPPEPPAVQPPVPALPSVPPLDAVDQTLIEILSWKRRHDTRAENKFLTWLRAEIKRRGATPRVHAAGNVSATIAPPDGKATDVLFSCHVDTQHKMPTVAVGAEATGEEALLKSQQIMYDGNLGHLFLSPKDKGWAACLGADDGAGVWIMLEMIKAKVPGTYLFHRGEECGFIGASAMVQKEKEFLEKFAIAVAFDRPGTTEVITTQGGDRCCSAEFARELAKRLNDTGVGLSMVTSDHGGVTDTNRYRHIIPECCNVAAGYRQQHHEGEWLDYGFLVKMRDAVLKVKWKTLPVYRDPTAPYYQRSARGNFKGGGRQAGVQRWGGSNGVGGCTDTLGGQRGLGFGMDHDDDDGYNPFPSQTKSPEKPKESPQLPKVPALTNEQEIEGQSLNDIQTFVEEYPIEAAAMLIDMASEIASLKVRVEFLRSTLK